MTYACRLMENEPSPYNDSAAHLSSASFRRNMRTLYCRKSQAPSKSPLTNSFQSSLGSLVCHFQTLTFPDESSTRQRTEHLLNRPYTSPINQ